jgi:hypothetical protein
MRVVEHVAAFGADQVGVADDLTASGLVLAQAAVDPRAEAGGAAVRVEDPGPHLEGRAVADVAAVTARKLRHPIARVARVVLDEPQDLPVRHPDKLRRGTRSETLVRVCNFVVTDPSRSEITRRAWNGQGNQSSLDDRAEEIVTLH